MLISDQAKDLVKNCLEGGGCMSPFQPLVYIRDLNKSIVSELRKVGRMEKPESGAGNGNGTGTQTRTRT